MELQDHSQKVTVGLAMSGAAARSVFYIGFLEALSIHGVPVDYIAAYSGAAIVSAAYATGNLQVLKEDALNLNRKTLFSLFKRSEKSGGWYNLDLFEEHVRERYTNGLKLEEVTPRLCFLATDIQSKQSVRLSLGDIAKAVKISCSMPGVFEPVQWGNQLLVDGGLAASIPGDAVRDAGIDIVIGVQVRSNKYFFFRNDRVMNAVHRQIKRFSFLRIFEPWFEKLKTVFGRMDIFGYIAEIRAFEAEDSRNLGIFSILGKCLDIAVESSKRQKDSNPNMGCDLIISTGTPSVTGGVNVHAGKELYERGLLSGHAHAAEILSLIAKKQKEKDSGYVMTGKEGYARN